ncbi:hypothetical protein HGRIS_000184 [Hohenbuehelia grisea]|uniref:RNA helicase n=1 Tax=Hohenbuehelia grisea TaxID=104357 RepID=A0ABR3JQA9_9AGAR
MEFTCEDRRLRKRFIIARQLSAIVGSQADHDLLKPSAPYVAPQRSARQPESKVVEGVFPASLKAVPYIGKLPPAFIPKQLASMLAMNAPPKEVLESVRNMFLPRVLNSESYARHFKYLLWIEEQRMEHDLEIYDIPNATLSRHNQYYYLDVPGLAEKRPSVLVGDRILVQPHGAAEGHWFEGGVHVVRKEEVGLRFHPSFRGGAPGQRYHVHFKLNRYPLRRQHLAMDTAFATDRALFPTMAHAHSAPHYTPQNFPFDMYNSLIRTNLPQYQAVVSIVKQPLGSTPFIIFGPPGTGKTMTMIEAILQVLRYNRHARILACAPSNSAADLLVGGLKSLGKDALFRFYAPSRSKNQVEHDLLPFTYLRDDLHFSVPPIARMKAFRVVVTTCVSASVISGIGIPRGHYSHIFIDEAGQATEPESMVSIKTIADNSTNIVLSGDPKQLGPIIRSKVARDLKLDISYIERLMELPVYSDGAIYGKTFVKLVKNFRSHAAILKFPNERFYADELQQCAEQRKISLYIGSKHLPSKRFPIIFHAVLGKDDREASSPSFFNADEAIQVKQYIEALRSDRKIRIADKDIGVITPYHAQVGKIRKALLGVADSVKVGSTEEFQGQERPVIIISTVRSSREFVQYDLRHTLGFVANPRRFNVAVTRAQALLIIVGDPNVLSLDPLWRAFLNYIHLNGGWKGAPPSWDTSEEVDELGGYDARVRNAAVADMNALADRMEDLTLAAATEEDLEAEANVDRPWREVE